MNEVTQLLNAIQQGQPHAAEALLPIVYDEQRNLARHKLRQERPAHTLEQSASHSQVRRPAVPAQTTRGCD